MIESYFISAVINVFQVNRNADTLIANIVIEYANNISSITVVGSDSDFLSILTARGIPECSVFLFFFSFTRLRARNKQDRGNAST